MDEEKAAKEKEEKREVETGEKNTEIDDKKAEGEMENCEEKLANEQLQNAEAGELNTEHPKVVDNTSGDLDGKSQQIDSGIASPLTAPLPVTGSEYLATGQVDQTSADNASQSGSNKESQQRFVVEKDKYCWVCHKEGVSSSCGVCTRSYHTKCSNSLRAKITELENNKDSKTYGLCPACTIVMQADCSSNANEKGNKDQLIQMFLSICDKMRALPEAEPFLRPVQLSEAEDYYDFIVYPMNLQTIYENIKAGRFISTEALLAEAEWLVHNSTVYNSAASEYTKKAKKLLKICKQELSEIDSCFECYAKAQTGTDNWFTEPCKQPHILCWAKMKKHPFWPAKAMRMNGNQIEVRFFGQHESSWVNTKDCFFYSEEMSVKTPKKKSQPLTSAFEEFTQHVEKLKVAYGRVVFQPARTPIAGSLSLENVQKMFPDYLPEELSHQSVSALPTPAMDKNPPTDFNPLQHLAGEVSKKSFRTSVQQEPFDRVVGKPVPISSSKQEIASGEKLIKSLGNVVKGRASEVKLNSLPSPSLVKQEPPEEVAEHDLTEDEEFSGEDFYHIRSFKKEHVPILIKKECPDVLDEEVKVNDDSSDCGSNKISMLAGQRQNQAGTNKRKSVGNIGNVNARSSKTILPQRKLVQGQEGGNASGPKKMRFMKKANDHTFITPNGHLLNVKPKTGNYEIGIANHLPNSFATQDNPTFTGVPLDNQKSVPPSFAAGIQDITKSVTELLQSTLTTMVGSNINFNNPHEELERVKNRYRKRMKDLKDEHDMDISILREEIKVMEMKFEQDIQQAVEETKKKSWCSNNCGNESLFRCCWGASYCGNSCQEAHWMVHMNDCRRSTGAAGAAT